MSYLDFDRLEALDPVAYQTRDPYPFVNPAGLLHDDAYRKLVENLPSLELFEKLYGKQRWHGQKPHDRYALEFDDELRLPSPWREFIDELQHSDYKRMICRLVGARDLELRFHWHWATTGDSVSPHCDARRKLGSHVFYLNTAEEWDPMWGGETVVLDDGGRFKRGSAPSFEAFDSAVESLAVGNQSFIFTRRGNSWHGVKPLVCPEGQFRKVFIVVLNRSSWSSRFRLSAR